MEDLNKQQLILLTLLVSFVTSTATGIITFTLLQEAPVEVTNTINRVVERTIEQVAPTDSGKTVVKEVQIVSEEDSVLDSIDEVSKSVVRIKTLGSDGAEMVLGLGLVVSEDGVVVVDANSLSSGPNYTIYFQDGAKYPVTKSYKDPTGNLVFLNDLPTEYHTLDVFLIENHVVPLVTSLAKLYTRSA